MAAFTTMAIIAGISTGLSIYQQHKASKAAKKAAQDEANLAQQGGTLDRQAAENQAGVFDWNASIADWMAQDAIGRGAEEEKRFREGVKGIIGSIRSDIAGANIDVGYGSALDVQADAAYLGELDALQIRSNSFREAFGYTVEAYDYRERARITREAGRNLELAGTESARRITNAAGEAAKQARWNMAQTILGGGVGIVSAYGGAGGGRRRTTAPKPYKDAGTSVSPAYNG